VEPGAELIGVSGITQVAGIRQHQVHSHKPAILFLQAYPKNAADQRLSVELTIIEREPDQIEDRDIIHSHELAAQSLVTARQCKHCQTACRTANSKQLDLLRFGHGCRINPAVQGSPIRENREMNEVTQLFWSIEQGDPNAPEKLFPIVYEDLRREARFKMAAFPPGQTLQPTALVHEAFIRLVKHDGREWQGRSHFFNAAAEAMRQILVDRARRKGRVKRGSDYERLYMDHLDLAVDTDDATLLQVNDALEKLTREDPEAAEFVKLRFFVGFSVPEIAKVLEVSERTSKRLWAFARAWLFREIKKKS